MKDVIGRVGPPGQVPPGHDQLSSLLTRVLSEVVLDLPSDCVVALRECAEAYFPDEEIAKVRTIDVLEWALTVASKAQPAEGTPDLLDSFRVALAAFQAGNVDHEVQRKLSDAYAQWIRRREEKREAYLKSDDNIIVSARSKRGPLTIPDPDDPTVFGLIWAHEPPLEESRRYIRDLRERLLDTVGVELRVIAGSLGCLQLLFSARGPYKATDLAMNPVFISALAKTKAKRLRLFGPQPRTFELAKLVGGIEAVFEQVTARVEPSFDGSPMREGEERLLSLRLENLPNSDGHLRVPAAHVVPRAGPCYFDPPAVALDLGSGHDSISIQFVVKATHTSPARISIDLVIDSVPTRTLATVGSVEG